MSAVSLNNIRSFTDFQRNAKQYATQIQTDKTPVVLTVNGEAALVVCDASAFQEMLERLQTAEQELQQLKLDTLRQDLESGLKQLEQGQGVSGRAFFEKMRQRSQSLSGQSSPDEEA